MQLAAYCLLVEETIGAAPPYGLLRYAERTFRLDYTQQALSENLLDLPRFLKGGGRWVTREEILDGGLEETAQKLAKTLGATTPARAR